MRIKSIFLGVVAFAMTGVLLSAQDRGGGQTSLTLDFSATAVSVNNDGDVDSFADAGFGEDNESTLSFTYESELFGGTATLAFPTDPDLYIMGESESGALPLDIDELFVWVKPFGEHFKFTGGIFANTDGVADYTDDIDNFGMGVFYDKSEGDNGVYAEPVGLVSGPALGNGFLAEAAFGPVTAQLLLAPNLSNKAAGAYFTGIFENMGLPLTVDDAEARMFRIGGRVIADIGVGTVSALFKTIAFPVKPFNDMYDAMYTAGILPAPRSFLGKLANTTTFGAYFDLTAVENLGVSIGYTGFLVGNDDSDAKASVYSGIDLRATWTGIEGLSLSTHNNVSFAKGEDWYYGREADSSFFTLYNNIGVTKELNEKFSVNADIGNIFSKTDAKGGFDGDKEIEHNNFWGGLKLITSLTENTEFTLGAKIDLQKNKDEDMVTVFSVPVGITVSF